MELVRRVNRVVCFTLDLCVVTLIGLPVALGQAIELSQWVGVSPLTITPGANCISPPLTGLTVYRGAVSAVTSNSLAVTGLPADRQAGSPAWTINQFAAQPVGPHTFPQYLVLLRQDAAASPGVDGSGDWWPVTANTSNTLTLDPRGDSLPALLAAGDEIELRRLLSLRDLFGHGDSLVLHPDRNGFASRREEDVIRYVSQTYFTHEIFYHDGSLTGGQAGWIIDGDGPHDGAAITLEPGQPLMVFRQDGSTSLTVAVVGQLQDRAWTHRLKPGANAVALPHPVAQPIATCGLLEAGWQADSDGFGGNDDHLRNVIGTSFAEEVFYHDGTYNSGTPSWVVDGVFSADYALQPGRGYVFFIKHGGGLRWRQLPPFSLP